ncbi:hypothetical protein N7504_006340 [Penicillium tannophilum]|nr:hypothetical protein N7504_006340 [Penicillium tannophilum]
MGIFSDDSWPAMALDEYRNLETYHGLKPELLGAAIAYQAGTIYDDYCAKNGAPTDDTNALKILEGQSNDLLDREIESKGFNWIDKTSVRMYIKENFVDGLREQHK